MIKIDYSLQRVLPKGDTADLPIFFKNNNRNMEHFLSRYALSFLIDNQKRDQDFFKRIRLKNFQHIEEAPGHIFSVAHTKEAALAIMAEKKDFLGVGCDIESSRRSMPKNAEKHFMNTLDKNTRSSLEAWCIKEACFKALANSGKKIKLLKEVIIDEQNFYLSHDPKSTQLNTYKILKDGLFIMVIASCAKTTREIELKKQLA